MVELPEPHRLEANLVMLCEGASDNEFFERLIEKNKLPPFSFPFPPHPKFVVDGAPALHGRDGFINMLTRLNDYFKLVPELNARMKGILLAVDAAENADETFQAVKKQVADAGEFGVPNKPQEIAKSSTRPALSIIVVSADGKKGSLESLCVEAMAKKFDAEAKCMESFFKCCPTDFAKWKTERYDKARLRCMIAATYEPDPSRSTGTAFSKAKNKPAAIDIGDDVFKPLAEELKAFCEGVESA